MHIQKYGSKHPTEPKIINKTDTVSTFDFIRRNIIKYLKDNKDAGEMKLNFPSEQIKMRFRVNQQQVFT